MFYLQEDTINEIALKVSAWHDSIRPHLEREEGRTNFDIHEYGSKILQQFPQSNAKTTLSFADCIQNQPREEIPRYFLSSLLLVCFETHLCNYMKLFLKSSKFFDCFTLGEFLQC